MVNSFMNCQYMAFSAFGHGCFSPEYDLMDVFCFDTSTLPGTAQPNKDYIPLTNASVVIPKGHSEGNITISILNDSIPELGEMFGVKLEYVQLIGPPTGFDPRLGSIERANVTILYNDNAHGLFVILAKTADPGSGGSKVTVAEQENLAVELIINRLGGTLLCYTIDACTMSVFVMLNIGKISHCILFANASGSIGDVGVSWLFF